MRKTITIATFVALGAATVGVKAVQTVPFATGNPNMKGSDTLKEITQDLITANALNLIYDGTGSSNGQSAVVSTSTATTAAQVLQTIAPMSRMLNNGASLCTTTTANLPKAEGIAFALDGVSVVAADANTAACSNEGETCTPDGTGLKVSGSNDWRETLRLIYAGMPTSAGNTIANRDCNSTARRTLVDNWSNLFQNSCAGCADSNPDSATTEPGLRHAFRRDEESGTTDVFLTLLNLPTINFSQGSTGTSYERAAANSVFCNVKRATDNYRIPFGAQPHPLPSGQTSGDPDPANPDFTWDDNANPGLPLVAPFYPEFQDMDPIRRKCAGTNDIATNGTVAVAPTEEVCGPQGPGGGTLGLVLPINPPPSEASGISAYPTNFCSRNRFRLGDAPRNRLNQPVTCPNGDSPLGQQCLYPVRDTGDGLHWDFACINGRNNVPSTRFSSKALVPRAPFGTSTTSDGRVYNLFPHVGVFDDTVASQASGVGAFRTISRPNPSSPLNKVDARIAGAFYRIHVNRSLNTTDATLDTCRKDSATDQLGCLAKASPCSFSYAGGEATALNTGTRALRVNQIPAAERCIQNLEVHRAGEAIYPMSRLLFVNSYRGFSNLVAAAPFNESDAAPGDTELRLVRAFASISDAKVRQYGFVPLVNDPICADLNEATVCPTQSGGVNVNACNTAHLAGLKSCENSDTLSGAAVAGYGPSCAACGNGQLDAGEICDDGNLVAEAIGIGCKPDCSGTN